MSDTTRDRTEGKLDQAQGTAQEKLGDLRGDDRQATEGRANQAEGQGKETGADLKDAAGNLKEGVSGAADKLRDAAKRNSN